MTNLNEVVTKFARVLKPKDRKLYYETILAITVQCANTVKDRDTQAFREFLMALKEDRIIETKAVNLPKEQEIKGEINITNPPEVKSPNVEIKDVNITNRKSPKQYTAVRLSDGKQFINNK